jgi:hypothetical protein
MKNLNLPGKKVRAIKMFDSSDDDEKPALRQRNGSSESNLSTKNGKSYFVRGGVMRAQIGNKKDHKDIKSYFSGKPKKDNAGVRAPTKIVNKYNE